MTRLEWAPYRAEVGVDHGVFYPKVGDPEPWNGLVSVDEKPTFSDNPRYLDGVKIGIDRQINRFAATVKAFYYPDAFWDDLLSQRKKSIFDFSYRTNDRRIHLIYNAVASINNQLIRQKDTEPIIWDITSMPVEIPNHGPSAHLSIDVEAANPDVLTPLYDILYGTDILTPRMPTPEEIIDLFMQHAELQVTDHGDGTATIEGPYYAVWSSGVNEYTVEWPSVIYIDGDLYRVSSY